MAEGDLGPLVLAGSGEYTPAMDIVDKYLLERIDGSPVVLIATSCAMEGEDVMTKWEQMGVEHFKRLGIDAVPVRIKDKDDANDGANAEIIDGAGLVWFSGGSAVYLAQAFEGTLAWVALEAANRRGAAVAGASGGLGVLNADVPALGQDTMPGVTALGLAAPVRAIAHFDRAEARRPEFVQRIVESVLPGQVAVGVDEDTTVVWTEGAWRAMGHKRVVVFADGGRQIYEHGDTVPELPRPQRERPA
jgi:cyanophycinase-like exopeptidase